MGFVCPCVRRLRCRAPQPLPTRSAQALLSTSSCAWALAFAVQGLFGFRCFFFAGFVCPCVCVSVALISACWIPPGNVSATRLSGPQLVRVRVKKHCILPPIPHLSCPARRPAFPTNSPVWASVSQCGPCPHHPSPLVSGAPSLLLRLPVPVPQFRGFRCADRRVLMPSGHEELHEEPRCPFRVPGQVHQEGWGRGVVVDEGVASLVVSGAVRG